MRATQSAVGRTLVPGSRVDGRPGAAFWVLGRREGRASAAPSRLLLSVRAVGDPALSRIGAPSGASARWGLIEYEEGYEYEEDTFKGCENLIMPD